MAPVADAIEVARRGLETKVAAIAPPQPSSSLTSAPGSQAHAVEQATSLGSKTQVIIGLTVAMAVVAMVVSFLVLRRKKNIPVQGDPSTVEPAYFDIQRNGTAFPSSSSSSTFDPEKSVMSPEKIKMTLEKPERCHRRESVYVDYFQDEYDQFERRRRSYLLDVHQSELLEASLASAVAANTADGQEKLLRNPSSSSSSLHPSQRARWTDSTSKLHQAVLAASNKIRNQRRQSQVGPEPQQQPPSDIPEPLTQANLTKKEEEAVVVVHTVVEVHTVADESKPPKMDDNNSVISRNGSVFIRPPKSTRRVSSRESLNSNGSLRSSTPGPELQLLKQERLDHGQKKKPVEVVVGEKKKPSSYQQLYPSSHHRNDSCSSLVSQQQQQGSSSPSVPTRSTSRGSHKRTYSKPIHIRAHPQAGHPPPVTGTRTSESGSSVGYQSRNPNGYM
ncbi:hypothetical protein BGX28_002744 [Mortierella sp. GBA30]|nr:hypothetical protein BGX28_002744 [Mortierella sp. GBA30]